MKDQLFPDLLDESATSAPVSSSAETTKRPDAVSDIAQAVTPTAQDTLEVLFSGGVASQKDEAIADEPETSSSSWKFIVLALVVVGALWIFKGNFQGESNVPSESQATVSQQVPLKSPDSGHVTPAEAPSSESAPVGDPPVPQVGALNFAAMGPSPISQEQLLAEVQAAAQAGDPAAKRDMEHYSACVLGKPTGVVLVGSCDGYNTLKGDPK